MKYSITRLLKRTFIECRVYWPHITGLFILKLLATPLALMMPFAMKILIDSGFGTVALPAFVTIFFPHNFKFDFNSIIIISASLLILIALIDNIIAVVAWIFETYTGEKIVLNFRTTVFNHIQRLSLAYHDTKGI